MTELLSAAFVIAILIGFVIASALAAFVCLLADKGRAAAGWAIAFFVGGGFLISILGGF